MDPASIIGTTSGVLSFITFCVQAVRVGHKVHKCAGDAADDTGANEYTQCKRFCQTFQPTLERLRNQANNSGRKDGISNAERSLLQIVTLCDSVGAEIIGLMEKYEFKQPLDPSPSKDIRKRIREKVGIGKHVIRVTLRALWDHEEAKELRTRFNECVVQLSIHLSEVNKQEILGEIHNIAQSVKYLQRETPALRTSLEHSLTRLDKKNEKLGSQIEEIVGQIDSAGSSLGEKIDKLSENLDHITNLHKAMNTVFAISQDTLENINRSRILKAISFPTRLARQSQINQRILPDETFEWFIRDEGPPSSDSSSGPGPLTSFRQWLREGERIFHITGKPGSAKSTLMNFLQNHKDTEAMLRLWSSHVQTITSDTGAGSSEHKITIASTFLYNAANSENEKSAEGIYRTLLYTILEDHRQDLISTVFERYWNPWSWTPWVEEQKDITISRQELANAFDLVLRETNTSGWRYCIFIDGADEFQDRSMDKWKFANEIRRWTTEYPGTVKVCVSSREERPWIDQSFCPDQRRIKIHQYTKGDIKKLVEDRIADHHNFQEPRFGREEKADFIMTIVTKAEGVFLWVRHVLDLVVEQLDENQDIETLNQVLDTLPRAMEKMIDLILSRIQKINKDESNTIFKILLLKETWPRDLALSLAHYSMVKDLIKNPKFSQKPIPGDTMGRCMGDADSPISGQIDRFKDRFHLLFRGLVDIVTQPAPVYTSPWKKPPCGPCLKTLSHSLAFSHRSIYEYLKKRETYLAGSEDTVLTIIKCLTAQTNMGWCFGHSGNPSDIPGDVLMNQYIHGIVFVIRDTLRGGRNTSSARAVFTSLDDLDSSLISRLLMMNKRAAEANTGRRGYIPTVFAISCTMGLDSYVEWVLSNRPEEAWMGMREELQAMDLWKVCDLFMDLVPRGETGASWQDPESRVEAATMIQRLLKAGFSPNSRLSEKPDMATPWLGFLWRFIRLCYSPDALLWQTIDALLRSGAQPPQALSWEMIPSTESLNKFKVSFRLRNDEKQAVNEHRRTENEAKRAEDLEPEDEIEFTMSISKLKHIADVYAALMMEFPDGKATLRDIFCAFGPKDDPDIAATLENLYPDPEPEHESELENDEDTELSNSETALKPGAVNGGEAATAEPYLGSQEDTQPDLVELLKLKRRENTISMIVESPLFKTILGTVVGGVLGATVMYVIMRRTERGDTR